MPQIFARNNRASANNQWKPRAGCDAKRGKQLNRNQGKRQSKRALFRPLSLWDLFQHDQARTLEIVISDASHSGGGFSKASKFTSQVLGIRLQHIFWGEHNSTHNTHTQSHYSKNAECKRQRKKKLKEARVMTHYSQKYPSKINSCLLIRNNVGQKAMGRYA